MSVFFDPFFTVGDVLRDFRRIGSSRDHLCGNIYCSNDSSVTSEKTSKNGPSAESGNTAERPVSQPVRIWWPAVDVKETADSILLHVELPGLKLDEIDVRVHDGRVLSISGERKAERKEETDRWHRRERAYGRFQRIFRLPEGANVDKISASCDSGVLTVTVPKLPAPAKPEPKRISVHARL